MSFQVWRERFALQVAYSFPEGHGVRATKYPVLCFLHGDKECEPGAGKGKAIEIAMGEHGPLAKSAAPFPRSEFMVVCPQLRHPGGSVWGAHRDTVVQIVKEMHEREGGDPARTYLTGFSYGGNGVMDVFEAGGVDWKALWIVDAPAEPRAKSPIPTWISAGPYARRWKTQLFAQGYLERALAPQHDYVYHDYEAGHGDTSAKAYADVAVYEWLLARRR